MTVVQAVQQLRSFDRGSGALEPLDALVAEHVVVRLARANPAVVACLAHNSVYDGNEARRQQVLTRCLQLAVRRGLGWFDPRQLCALSWAAVRATVFKLDPAADSGAGARATHDPRAHMGPGHGSIRFERAAAAAVVAAAPLTAAGQHQVQPVAAVKGPSDAAGAAVGGGKRKVSVAEHGSGSHARRVREARETAVASVAGVPAFADVLRREVAARAAACELGGSELAGLLWAVASLNTEVRRGWVRLVASGGRGPVGGAANKLFCLWGAGA